MELPKVIVVATDFSAAAQAAQRTATALAKKLDARLYLLHAWQLPVSTWDGGWVLTTDAYAQIEAAERAALSDALERARTEVPGAQGIFVRGEPREAIMQVLHDVHADLVVMGTHGRRGLARLVIGSVAEHIVRQAPCAALISRSPD